MKRNIIFAITLFIGLFGAFKVNAQTDLNGRYALEVKNGKDTHSFYLTFEREDAVYLSYFYEGAGTIGGKWTIENGVINAVLTRGDANWTLKLKPKGRDVEIAEALPQMNLPDIPDFTATLSPPSVFKKDVSKPSGPDLTPEEIGKKVLKLVQSLRTIKDISPKNIKRQTGIKVATSEKYPGNYGFGGNVAGAPDWFYNINAYPYPSKDNKTTDTLRFSFDYQLHEPLHPDMATVCKAFNFDAFSKELQQAGYSAPTPRYGVHSMLSGWNFIRGKVSLYVGVKGGRENKGAGIDNCVNMLIVSFQD